MRASGSSVGTAVVTLGVGAAVCCAFALFGGSVGAAVVAFGVGAAVGRTFTAACCRHVVIVECHDHFLSWAAITHFGGTPAKGCPNAGEVAILVSKSDQAGSLERVLLVARDRCVRELTVRFDMHGAVLMGARQVRHLMAVTRRASSEEPDQHTHRRRPSRDNRRPRQGLSEPDATLDLDDPLFCMPKPGQLVHGCGNAHDEPVENQRGSRSATGTVLSLTGRHDMMGGMDGQRVKRTVRALGAVLGVIAALLMCGPTAGVAHAAVAAPAGDAIAIGDPHALGVVDLYVDPMCPFSGELVREQGDEIGRRIEDGTLRVNLRFVDFLDKYSASKTYDIRAIYAAFVVADQSRSSEVTWGFVQQIFSAEQQPQEGGATDLDNNQLAELADRAGAPQLAQDLIRLGLPIGYDARAVAASNLAVLRQNPEPGVPTVMINGAVVDGESDWLDRLPG